jgi:hypothetical protein
VLHYLRSTFGPERQAIGTLIPRGDDERAVAIGTQPYDAAVLRQRETGLGDTKRCGAIAHPVERAIVNGTVPSPVPLAVPCSFIQSALLDADHAQRAGALTGAALEPPSAPKCERLTLTTNVQALGVGVGIAGVESPQAVAARETAAARQALTLPTRAFSSALLLRARPSRDGGFQKRPLLLLHREQQQKNTAAIETTPHRWDEMAKGSPSADEPLRECSQQQRV